MTRYQEFTHESPMPVSAEELYRWHVGPAGFARLVPPWESVTEVAGAGPIAPGSRKVIRMRMGILPLTWEALHQEFVEGRSFTDIQVRGPFSHWRHTHSFEPIDADHSTLRDHIVYRLPGGRLGQWLGGASVRRRLEQSFAFRHRRTRQDLVRHRLFASHGPQQIRVIGGARFVRDALYAFLQGGGHRVKATEDWSGNAEELDGLDGVVDLGWSAPLSHELCTALGQLPRPPRVIVTATGVDASAEATLCQAGIRWIHLHLPQQVLANGAPGFGTWFRHHRRNQGPITGPDGEPASWVALDDLVGIVHFLLFAEVSGGVDAAAQQADAPPSPLIEAGFQFLYPELERALAEELGQG